MQTYISSVSPKGQVTIPKELRDLLDVKPKDKVAFQVDKKVVKIVPATTTIDAVYQKVHALKKSLSLSQMAKIAADEHAKEAAHEGI